MTDSRWVRRDGAGVTLLIDVAGPEPVIVHFGAALPTGVDLAALPALLARDIPPSALAVTPPISLTPTMASGYSGAPGLIGDADGRGFAPWLRLVAVEYPANDTVLLISRDPDNGLELRHLLCLAADTGVLEASAELINIGSAEYRLAWLAAPVLSLDGQYTRLLGVSGRWAGEFQLAESPLQVGAQVRENRQGRSSHEAFPGLVLLAEGTTASDGAALALALAASGNHSLRVDRFADGRGIVMAGELLLPGEVTLAPGDAYATPVERLAWSDTGLSGIAAAMQAHVRRHVLPANVAARPRPVQFNSWEAVYFDQDPVVLADLAAQAAALGVERFVLDDGWFGGRRDDSAGLGDWQVSAAVWPQGLRPLIAQVQALGMEFGLWVEPEMVNPDSDLFRGHPDWVLALPGVPQRSMRHQLVLDLTRIEVAEYLFAALDRLLRDHAIAYLKWDMNRDISHPGGSDGRARGHAQTGALHALIDRLRAAHPRVEIESCASGGARADHGMLARAERVWASDSNDAIDRLAIQRGAALFLPPEVVGSHVGPRDCHTTGRRIDIATRAGVALFGHMGLEMDLRELTGIEAATLARAIALHKSLRPLLHGGRPLLIDTPPWAAAHGVIADDGSAALYSYALVASPPTALPGRLRLAGLIADAPYRLHCIWPEASPEMVVAGGMLATIGMELPRLLPQQLRLFHAEKI
jgi:alpha-galactosidase